MGRFLVIRGHKSKKTAHALYDLVGDGGEFVCYPLNDQGLFRWVRFHLINKPLRTVLSQMPFGIILSYARLMALLRLVPVLGFFLKSGFCFTGNVPRLPDDSAWSYLKRRFKNTSLKTFDWFGSHAFQHYKTDD